MRKLFVALGLFASAMLSLPLAANARDLPDFTELVEKQGATVVEPLAGLRLHHQRRTATS
jgi:hypothetical protein